jgi:transcriptional regulator with XRE-family HTH domain
MIQNEHQLGLTQLDLAAKLGIKEQMVQRYEASGHESIASKCQLICIAKSHHLSRVVINLKRQNP